MTTAGAKVELVARLKLLLETHDELNAMSDVIVVRANDLRAAITALEAPHSMTEAMRIAGDEMADKLWVLRCENRSAESRLAAERAINGWLDAKDAMQAARPIDQQEAKARWRCVNCKAVTPIELSVAPKRCLACRCSEFAEVAKLCTPIAPVQDDER